jgi:hypothetical protein
MATKSLEGRNEYNIKRIVKVQIRKVESREWEINAVN